MPRWFQQIGMSFYITRIPSSSFGGIGVSLECRLGLVKRFPLPLPVLGELLSPAEPLGFLHLGATGMCGGSVSISSCKNCSLGIGVSLECRLGRIIRRSPFDFIALSPSDPFDPRGTLGVMREFGTMVVGEGVALSNDGS